MDTDNPITEEEPRFVLITEEEWAQRHHVSRRPLSNAEIQHREQIRRYTDIARQLMEFEQNRINETSDNSH